MNTAGGWWERFFDAEYARIWGEFASGDDEARSLWRILGLGEGSRVLDAGCGFGRVSLPLARLGASVLGVDQSAALLEEAERRRGDLGPERLRYLRHDLRLPLPESGFDVALSLFSSLGYGTDDEDAAILRTLASALRPGGRVAVDSMHRDVLAAHRAREANLAHRLPDGTLLIEEPRFDPVAGRVETTWFWSGPAGSGTKSASLRVYTITELVRLMEEAGLRLEAALHPGSGTPFSASGPSMGGRVLLVAERPPSARDSRAMNP
jgi:SAM-dependent methyltransferase